MTENNSSNTNATTTIASLNELTSAPRSLLKDAWFRLIRNKGAVVAMVIITIFVLGALFANKIVPHNPLQMNSGKDFLPPFGLKGVLQVKLDRKNLFLVQTL